MRRWRPQIRRQVLALLVITLSVLAIWANLQSTEQIAPLTPALQKVYFGQSNALDELEKISVKGRSAKNNYKRSQFGDGWDRLDGCSVREVVLARDLTQTKVDDKCRVQSGYLDDPYTGQKINFKRGPQTSQAVQIDHVVALSDAWQKGAQYWDFDKRRQFANDPLNLLAVDGPTNQNKGAGDAATWLPPNKLFRCQYVARQTAVKKKYGLWMTAAEKTAIKRILEACTTN